LTNQENMDWVEGIGLLAGVIGVLGWYPQVKRIWVDKKADGISVPSFTAIAISLFLWLAYGIIKKSIAIVVANILALTVIIAIAVGAYRIQSAN
jgi:MtN3 and saliva related transmembrane protein|tara:strand:+ start:1647 stop:1928 length:282 start_codon:yes stop_codon:yes gene_type:complete